MKIDQEYLKGLLEAFQAAKTPTTDIRKLENEGIAIDDQYIFHLQILSDKNLVKREQGIGLGYVIGADGSIGWSVVPLRLTAEGHEFIEALKNREVWSTIKSEFKDASVETLLNVSKKLFEGYINKKITSLLS